MIDLKHDLIHRDLSNSRPAKTMKVKTMSWHTFTLLFEIPYDSSDSLETWADPYIEALGEAGCTDVTVGSGVVGYLNMDFCYRAQSRLVAIEHAVNDVIRAIPTAKLRDSGLTPIERSESRKAFLIALGFYEQKIAEQQHNLGMNLLRIELDS